MEEQNNMSKHIDKNVIFFFIAVFLVSGSLLGYKYYKNIPCKEVIFSFKADEFRQGELINFFDETEGAKIWSWKFGDSTDVESLKDPIHIFKKPGEYKVTLLVNNTCEKVVTINIKEKLELLDPDKFPKFTLPKSIMVGEKLKVKDMTENASTWEWRFGETSSVNAKTRYASYVYEVPGLKTVSLVVNGDLKYMKEQRILVTPKPEEKTKIPLIKAIPRTPDFGIKAKPKTAIKEKPKEKPKAKKIVPFINEANFKNKIILVSKDKMRPRQFSEYMCGNINQSIVVNGKNTTFLVFCQKIQGKKIKIKRLSLFRDPGSNCIKSVAIKYRSIGVW